MQDQNIEQQIQREIMKRVRFVYLMRKFKNPILLETTGIFFCLAVGFFMLSIRDIYSNLTHLRNFKEALSFLFTAFLKTEILVQGTLIVFGALSALLTKKMWSITKPISYIRSIRIFGRGSVA